MFRACDYFGPDRVVGECEPLRQKGAVGVREFIIRLAVFEKAEPEPENPTAFEEAKNDLPQRGYLVIGVLRTTTHAKWRSLDVAATGNDCRDARPRGPMTAC